MTLQFLVTQTLETLLPEEHSTVGSVMENCSKNSLLPRSDWGSDIFQMI